MFGNRDIRAHFSHKCHIKQNDCKVMSPNDYFPHISYILWLFLNIILFQLLLNQIAALSKWEGKTMKFMIYFLNAIHVIKIKDQHEFDMSLLVFIYNYHLQSSCSLLVIIMKISDAK